ncbi:uncharacterized protein BDCG_04214 [Blastomyces dermatitidis ER-3]|uniref:Uncharacterized protein n=2 Tax=Ajellomyces dermatitidis TaxID=5039 RepID=F2TEC5_AJEDA|nr:uncharacterized protein BDCG_04214 [Blastomyces dermatitidis ER-3]EEQ89094.1 hypothetical protein BDCG_04214 [Blastomyces dermatitidis ER-3]EGE81588.1 hypothetical protein BDDG_04531 [Blastomyces dermatitidis ATCC 18188]
MDREGGADALRKRSCPRNFVWPAIIGAACLLSRLASAYGTSDVKVPDEEHTRYLDRQETGQPLIFSAAKGLDSIAERLWCFLSPALLICGIEVGSWKKQLTMFWLGLVGDLSVSWYCAKPGTAVVQYGTEYLGEVYSMNAQYK